MRGRVIAGIVVVVLIAVVGLVLIILDRSAPGVSSVQTSNRPCITAAQDCLRFPTISGQNLLGETMTLPADFSGQSVLVIVPFDENQQVQAQTWLPLANEIAAGDPSFADYDVAVFPDMAAPMRALIRGGMIVTISDEHLRAVTITAFLDDLAPFLSSLNIPNTDTMQVFLLNGDGEVLWRGSGAYSDAQGAELRALVTGG